MGENKGCQSYKKGRSPVSLGVLFKFNTFIYGAIAVP